MIEPPSPPPSPSPRKQGERIVRANSLLFAAILAALAGALAWTLFQARPFARTGPFLGYVEGDLLLIGPNEGERLAELFVDSGQTVAREAPLFTMATPLLDEQRAEAKGRLEQMQAQVENLKSALERPEQIAVLQAAMERAQAALKLSALERQRKKALFATGDVSKAALDQANMAYERDKAALEEAKRQVQAGRIPSRTHEIGAAEAAILQARAQLEQVGTRITRQHVVAPAAGVVQDVFFRPGEMVNAGQPVLSLLPPENRKVRFYVPEPQLSLLRLGAKLRVACDGCPQGLSGRISFISGREEFTPPVIFSDQERVKLVFKIEARLEGEARELPLGLPVEIFPWQGE